MIQPTAKQAEVCHAIYAAEQIGNPYPPLGALAYELGIAKSTCQARVDRCVELELLDRGEDGRVSTSSRYLNYRAMEELDVACNPLVTEVLDEHPEIAESWSVAERKALYSHRGVGGGLTRAGVMKKAKEITENQELKAVCESLLLNGATRERLAKTLRELERESKAALPKSRRRKKA